MSKRRLSETESVDDSQKNLNFRNRVDQVDVAIDMLIEDYTKERTTDDDAIAQSTHALARLRHGSSPLYIMRANALARKSKFKEAIQDAMTAIDYQPDAADGYLAAAHVYSMQGKENAAMSIIDVGLQRAVDDTTQLSERKMRMGDILNRKIDFVSRLPTEVTAAIFESLYCEFDRTLVYCSLVSKHWRHVVLHHCASLWKYVILDDRLIHFSPAAILLPVISKHVYSLALRRITSENALIEKIVDMAATDKFPLVSSISIVTSTLLLLEYHVSLITLFRNNLTKVSIDIIEFDMDMSEDEDDSETTPFSLNLILSLCPNLQELVFSSRQKITYYPLQPSSPNGYKLLNLALNIQHVEHLLERLIPNCPNLLVLNVEHLTPSVINLAYHRLPQLRYLKTFDYCHVDLSTLSSGNHQDVYGLYDLDCDIVGADQLQNMMLLLVASKTTLKNLNLFIRHPELIDGISQVAMLSFDVLTTLELFIMGHAQSFSDTIATALIRQCPMLENVTLTLGDTQVSEQFYDCLAMKDQLRFMDVSKVNSPPSGLQQFFDTLGNTRGALQGVVLGGRAVTDQVVYALTKVTTLKAITLRNCTMLSAPGVEAFLSRLPTLIALTEITLEAIPYLNDDMAVILSEVVGLQCIELGNLDLITSFGIRYLADHARHLRRLAVFSCLHVDSDALQYIARRFSYV